MIGVSANTTNRPKADLVVVPFFKGKNGAEVATDLPDLKDDFDSILEAGDFDGKEGSSMLTYLTGKSEKRLLFLGLGSSEECNMETLRRSFGSAIKQCQNKKWASLNIVLPLLKGIEVGDVIRAVSEGVTLSLYLFEEWKSEENQKCYHIKKITLIGATEAKIPEKTLGILSGVNLARDLTNGNALDVTPQTFAAEAKRMEKDFSDVKATILTKDQLEKEKMGLFLAVANGSRVEPALVMAEYKGDPDSEDLTMIVGKGITFDTGGINLKPTKFVEDMRADMGGGAAALGILQAAASIQLKRNIAVLVAATENGIDAESYKPGDVYRSYKGTTVEITNTDAEGRLVLADALSYGQKKFKPSRIIDLATLTGAVIIALGDERVGLFSNHDAFAQSCIEAGDKTGERVWRLPVDSEYKKLLRSNIADIANCATKRMAGATTAAVFLKEFIEEGTPWIHLDIAGTAFLDSPRDYHHTLATGAGVRLVVELLECLK